MWRVDENRYKQRSGSAYYFRRPEDIHPRCTRARVTFFQREIIRYRRDPQPRADARLCRYEIHLDPTIDRERRGCVFVHRQSTVSLAVCYASPERRSDLRNTNRVQPNT